MRLSVFYICLASSLITDGERKMGLGGVYVQIGYSFPFAARFCRGRVDTVSLRSIVLLMLFTWYSRK